MTHVTFQVLEGLERGRVYADLAPPFTIGREEENAIQLNDERISRFHAKVQVDGDRIILTDLDSTNGTRINGHPIQMHVLRLGDQLAIGRCLLVFGSREEIALHLRTQQSDGSHDAEGNLSTLSSSVDDGGSDDVPIRLGGPTEEAAAILDEEMGELFPDGPPGLPDDLRMGQRARVSDVLAYVHDQIGSALRGAVEAADAPGVMQLNQSAWQRLLQLEMDLATYLNRIANPDGD